LKQDAFRNQLSKFEYSITKKLKKEVKLMEGKENRNSCQLGDMRRETISNKVLSRKKE
jgi:hypothetical protein